MTKDQEKKVWTAVEDAIKMANAGTDPSAAIAKVASANSFSPDFVHRMCNAFNTSKTLAQIQSPDIQTKLAVFPLADPETALAAMYPAKIETPKEASFKGWIPESELLREVEDFNGVIGETKMAEAVESYQPDLNFTLSKLYQIRDQLRGELKSAHVEYLGAHRRVIDSLQKVASYFRRIPSLPFEQVDEVVQGHWGEDGQALMSTVHTLTKQAGFNFKRAEDVRPTLAPATGPFQLVREALEARDTLSDAATKQANAQESLTHFEEEFDKRLSFFKFAEGASGVLANVLMIDKLKDLFKPKPMSSMISDASEELAAPDYDAQQKALSAQVMLHDLMHSDPVISQHKPEEVMTAYNRLSAAYPRMAGSEMNLQAYLRRMLEGGEIDPHDLLTAQTMESALAKQPGGAGGPGQGAKGMIDND